MSISAMETLGVTRAGPNAAVVGGHPAPIRVLYVIGSLPLGGAENQVVTLASALDRSRYEVHVCCLRHEGVQGEVLRARGIQVVALNLRLRHWPIAVLRLYRLMRQLKPQIVHTHLYEADIWGRLVGKLAGTPVIVSTMHGRFYWRKHYPWLLFDRALNHFTDKVIAVSEDIRRSFLERQPISSDKVIAIPNAVDVDRFGLLDGRDTMRRQLGVDAGSRLVGTVARLVPEKRLDDLLTAACAIHESVPQARFIIVGDGPVREDLNSQAARLDLGPEILTFTGSRLDIPELLAAMDIFVISSETEGLPVSLLEAMAAAKAVVATRVGGVPQLIEDRQNGLLVPPCDPARLAKALLMLIEDSSLRERLASAAQRTVETRFSTRVVGQRIAALYDELLQRKEKRHAS